MSERRKFYIYIAVGIGALIGVYFFVLPMYRATTSQTYEQIGVLLGDLELAKQQASQSESFQLKYQAVLDKDAQINEYFFSRGNELKFFQLLEEAATKAGIEQKIIFTPGESAERIGLIPATLRLSVSFNQLIDYLDQLEHLSQPISVDNISLQESEPLAVTLEVSTYWYTTNEN